MEVHLKGEALSSAQKAELEKAFTYQALQNPAQRRARLRGEPLRVGREQVGRLLRGCGRAITESQTLFRAGWTVK